MKEYDLYIPLSFNDGRPVPRKHLLILKKSLVDHFGGLTNFPQSNEGLWRIGEFTFRDRIIIFRVLTNEKRKARAYFAKLKQIMEKDWQQADVLIIERSVRKI